MLSRLPACIPAWIWLATSDSAVQIKDSVFENLLVPIVFILLMLPIASIIWGVHTNSLGANPPEVILHTFGEWALRILVMGLAISPARRLFDWPQLLSLRRMFGLFAFYYLSLHFICYFWFELSLVLEFLIEDIIQRPFISFGFAAFVLLIPLVATSTRAQMRQLGKTWGLIHLLVYPTVIFSVIHFWLLVKSDTTEPLIYAVIVTLLFLERTWSRIRGT